MRECLKTPREINTAFYHSLGKLFYAIAAADKIVRPKELKKLQSCVEKYWLDLDHLQDVFRADPAYVIEVIFDGSIGFNRTSADAYTSFLKYYREQKQGFTPQVKSLVLKTARAIATSFSGINKAELILIKKLELEFNN